MLDISLNLHISKWFSSVATFAFIEWMNKLSFFLQLNVCLLSPSPLLDLLVLGSKKFSLSCSRFSYFLFSQIYSLSVAFYFSYFSSTVSFSFAVKLATTLMVCTPYAPLIVKCRLLLKVFEWEKYYYYYPVRKQTHQD